MILLKEQLVKSEVKFELFIKLVYYSEDLT